MLDKKFTEYLEEELGRILPDEKKKYEVMFKSLGFGDINQDFVEFWTNYSDEIYGKEGYLVDLSMDLEDFQSSQTQNLREWENLPVNYISFLHNELDDYLFYDKNTDEVYFVEAPNIKNFINKKQFDKKWGNFISFIKYFLDYNE
ncbi:Uncharacterised protein [Neisseria animaloris]|uniref:Knr4/Smi1-like domain-containing protein n=1 Tax=Neisseria wadsworthii 9715 TaxID=1030841 RepID=G4CN00_9NEIS|nr:MULTISPECIES: hypothetical protein [Neisseria]EGZ50928.1 hypothetical protein HMPREF9370_0459 [Neisseria wadsworthii 9715]OSI08881.1 hypothetical protein BWD08_01880 [Neisseria animaloris]QMT36459.1 hypothetical protein H3L96_04355 [Neisseria wadsworthii]VEH87141.1 Uncharacterised protein [Neisseria animaloris]